MKIVMLEPLGVKEDDITALAAPLKAKGHEFVYCGSPILGDDARIAYAAGADALIIANSPLRGRVIRAIPNLKLISVAFTGIDHVDAEACREKRIIVSNAQGYSTYAVAELTFGLIFSLLRNIIPCDSAARQGGTKDGLVGRELFGKTVGIVGTGAIGLRTAEIAKAFGSRLLGYSRTERDEAKALGIEYVSLDHLLAESDIVCLHVPLTEETKHLINKDRIGLMKRQAILINAARGGVIDSQALADALNEGRIAGAGLDVFETEPPLPADHPLLHSRNTVVSPHVAFATAESMLRRAAITFGNIYAWLEGRPQNVKLGDPV